MFTQLISGILLATLAPTPASADNPARSKGDCGLRRYVAERARQAHERRAGRGQVTVYRADESWAEALDVFATCQSAMTS